MDPICDPMVMFMTLDIVLTNFNGFKNFKSMGNSIFGKHFDFYRKTQLNIRQLTLLLSSRRWL